MSKEQYDLVVIGGGTAGYAAAIRASQLKKSVALVEEHQLGGTCLHRGCIPTKALLKSAKVLDTIKHASEFGIETEAFKLNVDQIFGRKDTVVNQMYQGVKHLMKQNKIDVYHGRGRLLGSSIFSPQSGTVSVEYEDGESELLPNHHVLITTGSKPMSLPFLPFDHKQILSSDDLLQMTSFPDSIAIIGGGVIGIEFASMLNDFGVDVHIIEGSSSILPNESPRIVTQLRRAFQEKGIHIYENVMFDEDAIKQGDTVSIQLQDQTIEVEKVLVAIGRAPLTDDLGLNNTKVQLDDRNFIQVSDYMQTDDSHIYAAGDCIGQLQLAHVGSKEGITAVEHMFDQRPIEIDYNKMPKCIYAQPEIASIGMTFEAAKSQGFKAKKHKVPFQANSKAVIESLTPQDGMCEMVVEEGSNEILGLSMIGPNVTELINEVSLLQFMNGSTLELGLTTHAHPSIGEVLMEMGLKTENSAIHV
ncbi:dihydrolipoyl dehydrogenase [Staphylococcus massiliensis]|uniref:Dihydrolipoyl dehydrogenase n=1 Tax=Staphylococcus massiliensis S46 TaxID=1229783 RepID=K9B4W6_9STAP|nr:dihydrolipoyl dehydrogenase [Staphylococcus massiliensis]EKU49847.1 dihydrolipoamide dehydrogenase [Staphylococcus massiliensis S46]POA02061.1 dihydrolipoyl dehydrogenase [Staphylococcus massiliensis CCUG 55927]